MRNYWVTSFWGFDPETWGCIGFTIENDCDRFLNVLNDGDRVLIYGSKSKNTSAEERGKALGLYELEFGKAAKVSLIDPQRFRENIDQGNAKKWWFSIPARRAWAFVRPMEISQVWKTYEPEHGRAAARYCSRLDDDSVEEVKSQPMKELPVYGRGTPPNQEYVGKIDSRQFRPSRAGPVHSGQIDYELPDSPRFIYLFRLKGISTEHILPKTMRANGRTIVKVGFSSSPESRVAALNGGFPEALNLRWEINWKSSRKFADGQAAKQIEDEVKRCFRTKGESLGGEFFLIRLETARTAINQICSNVP